jgi:hypothetical protein
MTKWYIPLLSILIVPKPAVSKYIELKNAFFVTLHLCSTKPFETFRSELVHLELYFKALH